MPSAVELAHARRSRAARRGARWSAARARVSVSSPVGSGSPASCGPNSDRPPSDAQLGVGDDRPVGVDPHRADEREVVVGEPVEVARRPRPPRSGSSPAGGAVRSAAARSVTAARMAPQSATAANTSSTTASSSPRSTTSDFRVGLPVDLQVEVRRAPDLGHVEQGSEHEVDVVPRRASAELTLSTRNGTSSLTMSTTVCGDSQPSTSRDGLRTCTMRPPAPTRSTEAQQRVDRTCGVVLGDRVPIVRFRRREVLGHEAGLRVVGGHVHTLGRFRRRSATRPGSCGMLPRWMSSTSPPK